ncbi:MAG: UDP-N-acetylmuramoyl-L-alanine--D-glutamate ligase [Pseudomonadota bacterium]
MSDDTVMTHPVNAPCVLSQSTVLVLGLGASGLAMARWCARGGAQVRVWDSRENPPQAEALRAAAPHALVLSGALEGPALSAALNGVDRVFKSPGLAPADERLAALFAQAATQGVPVQGELDLFVEALSELKRTHGYAPKVVAITGTNGKTTTTAMTHLLIGRTGLRTVMAGNIGPTMLQTLSDALDLEALPAGGKVAEALEEAAAAVNDVVEPEFADNLAVDDADRLSADDVLPVLDPEAPLLDLLVPPPAAPVFTHLPQVWVLELSSFQLHGVVGFEPSAATVLNITEDHLDWHGSLAAYAADKACIFGASTVRVVNQDDPMVLALADPAPAALVAVPSASGRGRPKLPKPVKTVPRPIVRFSLHAPQRPGDFGLVTEQGVAWLVRARELDETIKPKRGAARVEEELLIQRLMPADALRVRGRHNAANALAALALATAIGCPLAPMLHGLREYTGEPHRVAFVATLNGVDLVDDSKGTNVGATVAAILGLGADRAPARLVVILGGDGKGQNFEPLREPLQAHGRAVATLGRDAERIEAIVASLALPMQRFDTLPTATRWAVQQAQPGDTVLLSPACASLDMFDNYQHRAQVFVDEVRAMAQEQGEVIA